MSQRIRPSRKAARFAVNRRPSFHPVFPIRGQVWLDPTHNTTVKILSVVDGFVFFRQAPQDPVSLHLADFLDVYIRKH